MYRQARQCTIVGLARMNATCSKIHAVLKELVHILGKVL